MKDGSLEVIQLNRGVEIVYVIKSFYELDEYRDDPDAFIFTLKNPHGVPPTRLLKRKESDCAINGDPEYGPIFGNGCDIVLRNECNKKNSCSINNYGSYGYECHQIYKTSLFVGTNKPDNTNYFDVLEYEVFRYK